jgi:ABC-type multidrug transport system fused ATPase/permease subunit
LPTYIPVYWKLLFSTSSVLVSLFWQILAGWSLTSASVFAAAFFRKHQLSGVYVAVGFLVMALGAMIMENPSQQPPGLTAVTVPSLLFPSMNFVFAIATYCRFEKQAGPVDMLQTHPDISIPVSAVILWVFLIIQIIVYPVLAIFVEKLRHGISYRHRTFEVGPAAADSVFALQTSGLGKTYFTPWYKSLFCQDDAEDVVALEDLDLVSQNHQMLCLLGANGSGKTTTLDLIAGVQSPTQGSVRINATASQLGRTHLVPLQLSVTDRFFQGFALKETCFLINLPWLSTSTCGAISKVAMKTCRPWIALSKLVTSP